ncbi:MAG: hypothetical protein UT38_C0017G0017 [Microgenomates group bacterium GW2011_GWA2_39_19]|nr:MAG: hypothetical protein UT38_C0017G0017 [Microgenomates group bacterium GW2011_GWA2_39_19]
MGFSDSFEFVDPIAVLFSVSLKRKIKENNITTFVLTHNFDYFTSFVVLSHQHIYPATTPDCSRGLRVLASQMRVYGDLRYSLSHLP